MRVVERVWPQLHSDGTDLNDFCILHLLGSYMWQYIFGWTLDSKSSQLQSSQWRSTPGSPVWFSRLSSNMLRSTPRRSNDRDKILFRHCLSSFTITFSPGKYQRDCSSQEEHVNFKGHCLWFDSNISNWIKCERLQWRGLWEPASGRQREMLTIYRNIEKISLCESPETIW